MVRVAGTADEEVFLDGGQKAAESILGILSRAGGTASITDVLDFGCGCGRVLRWLSSGYGFQAQGADLDSAAIEWCVVHLKPSAFMVNRLEPPLSLPAGSLDMIYALSVFTHITPDLQRKWVGEFARVLRPNGYLILSTHGESYLGELMPAEVGRFQRGGIVVRFPNGAGSNLCNTFHPQAAFAELTGPEFEVMAFEPEGARGNPHQDLWLLRKGSQSGQPPDLA